MGDFVLFTSPTSTSATWTANFMMRVSQYHDELGNQAHSARNRRSLQLFDEDGFGSVVIWPNGTELQGKTVNEIRADMLAAYRAWQAVTPNSFGLASSTLN